VGGLIALMGVDAEMGVFMLLYLFTSFLLELVVYPAIYEIWKGHFEVKPALEAYEGPGPM